MIMLLCAGANIYLCYPNHIINSSCSVSKIRSWWLLNDPRQWKHLVSDKQINNHITIATFISQRIRKFRSKKATLRIDSISSFTRSPSAAAQPGRVSETQSASLWESLQLKEGLCWKQPAIGCRMPAGSEPPVSSVITSSLKENSLKNGLLFRQFITLNPILTLSQNNE